MPVGGEKADELGDQDQRPRRGLGEPKSVEHLAGGQPAMRLHDVLRHVGEHRIGAAERHHSELGEEQRDLGQHVRGAEHRGQGRQRHDPDGEPDCRRRERLRDRHASVRFRDA